MNDDGVSLRLSKQQALVLFEWIAKLESEKQGIFQHPAEEKVLWDIEAQLEKMLAEPFATNYLAILDQARNQIDKIS